MTANTLKNVALTVFALKGYDAAALSEIADGVGIKKPSIYAHYENKEQLFLSVLKDVVADFSQHWQTILRQTADRSHEEKLYALFHGIIDYFIQDEVKIAFWVRVWIFPPASLKEDVLAVMNDAYQVLTGEVSTILREGATAGITSDVPTEEIVAAFFALLHGFLARVICYGAADSAAKVPLLWKCFWSGIKK